jgi:hypothetical protein
VHQVKEIGTRDQMLLSRDAQGDRRRPDSDQDETRVRNIATGLHRAWATEAGPTVVSLNALLGKAPLTGLRHRVGQAAPEFDELLPVDGRFAAGNAFTAHTARVVDGLGRAKRQVVDGYAPPGRAA